MKPKISVKVTGHIVRKGEVKEVKKEEEKDKTKEKAGE